jgi:hypothetical protein
VAEHNIEVVAQDSELHLRFVCRAVSGAPCRRRPPAGDDRESWSADDPTLVDGSCWAVDWVEAVGLTDGIIAGDTRGVTETWGSIPVDLSYDEAVVIAPVAPHTTLLDGSYDMSNPDPTKSNTWVGGRQLTWQEKCEQLEVENRRLSGFARIVHDMSRNEFGRHEGDYDTNDPTGTSQGNPHHAVGDVFGYSIGGKRRAYARPERSQEDNPEAWIINATVEVPRG